MTTQHTEYSIPVGLREPQREMIEIAMHKIQTASPNFQLNLLSAGTGKSLGAIATADYLFSQTDIERVVFVTPRSNLKEQIARDYELYKRVYQHHPRHVNYIEPRMHTPLFGHGERGIIVPITYSFMVNIADHLLEHYADKRTAYIFDECEILGQTMRFDDSGDPVNPIQAAQVVKQIDAKQPGYIMMMTGTPYRHDGRPLILCHKHGYYENIGEGKHQLTPDVSCPMSRSIRLRYLRPLDLYSRGGEIVIENFLTGEQQNIDIEEYEGNIGAFLKSNACWQPVVFDALNELEAQRHQFSQNLKGLIAAVDNAHAERIRDYIKNDGRFVSVISTSKHDPANETLNSFRDNGGGDILITVRKASVGFDNPSVSVVGVLWNVRSEGANRQLIARGQRMRSDLGPNQYCSVLWPRDRLLNEIMENIWRDNMEGLDNLIPYIKPKQLGQDERNNDEQLPLIGIVDVKYADGFMLNGTYLDGTAEGDIAQSAKEIGNLLGVAANLVAEVWRRHPNAKQPAPQQPPAPKNEFDELCATYNATRQNIRERVHAAFKGHFMMLAPAHVKQDRSRHGQWISAGYATIKRHYHKGGVNKKMSPQQMHTVLEHIKDDPRFAVHIENMHNYLLNDRKRVS
jgi:hypothetical protein